MLLQLVGTVFAGIGAAGMMMLVNKATGSRLPKWTVPAAAGATMIGMAMSNEYTWYDRVKEQLPEGTVVINTVEAKAFYKPWTYVRPYTIRFMAVDTANMMSPDATPDQKIAPVFFYDRFQNPRSAPFAVNCARNERAFLAGGAEVDKDGVVTGAQWEPLDADDPMILAVCGG